MDTFKHFPDCIYLRTVLCLEVFRSGSGSANMMFVSTVQTYPIQYRSNRSACFLRSQTPSPPYCRGGDPPPASRQRRSGRRNEAGWPWSYREADGTTPISKHNNNKTVKQIFHWWTVPTVPGSKRALMSSKISATRMAKDRLAWMWYRWLRMVLTELKRGRKDTIMYHQHRRMECDEVEILTTKQRRWPGWWWGRRWRWSSQHNQWFSAPPGGQRSARQRDRQQQHLASLFHSTQMCLTEL